MPGVPGRAGTPALRMDSAHPPSTPCPERRQSWPSPGGSCPSLPGPLLSPWSTSLAALGTPAWPLYSGEEWKGANSGSCGLDAGLSEGRSGQRHQPPGQLTDPLSPPSKCTSRVSSLSSALDLSYRAPVRVWGPRCSLMVPSDAPHPCPLYLPVGRLHLGLQLPEECPLPGGCWAGRSLAGPWSALRGAGVPRRETAICLALGKGHGDGGLGPPAPTLVAQFLWEGGLVGSCGWGPTGSLLLFSLFLSPQVQGPQIL